MTLSREKALKIAEEVYFKTEQVISKLDLSTNWISVSNECIDTDLGRACKSNQKGLLKYSELEKHIKEMCTQDFTNEILKNKENIFKNIGENLYVVPLERNKDVFYEGVQEIVVKEISAKEIICTIVCNYYVELGEEKLFTMPFEFVIKKQGFTWKTDFFELPY